MSKEIYNINFNKLIALLLPVKLRNFVSITWLISLIQPFKDIHKKLMLYRYTALYKLQHTPQVWSIEAVLNDNFDRIERRIYIKDGVYIAPNYFYEPEEEKPIYFYESEEAKPVYFYEPDELTNADVDFEVVLPSLLTLTESDITLLNSLINFYKLPDKTYKISYE